MWKYKYNVHVFHTLAHHIGSLKAAVCASTHTTCILLHVCIPLNVQFAIGIDAFSKLVGESVNAYIHTSAENFPA